MVEEGGGVERLGAEEQEGGGRRGGADAAPGQRPLGLHPEGGHGAPRASGHHKGEK